MYNNLCRGKTITKPEHWEYGYAIPQEEYMLIRYWNMDNQRFEEYLVAPETVTGFTGYVDCNGKKIFKGDIVITKYERKYIVCWMQTERFAGWALIPIDGENEVLTAHDLGYTENLEIVGNIFDDKGYKKYVIN